MELNSKPNDGVKCVFLKSVEGLSDFLHKYMTQKGENTSGGPILFEETIHPNVNDTMPDEEQMENTPFSFSTTSKDTQDILVDYEETVDTKPNGSKILMKSGDN